MSKKTKRPVIYDHLDEVKSGPKECWYWEWTIDQGYGVGHLRGKKVRAHRIAYEYWVGLIPKGLVLDHTCEHPSCVNPGHLEPVTSAVNSLRGYGALGLNWRKIFCSNGHEFTEENTRIPPSRPNGRECRQCAKDAKWASYYTAQGREVPEVHGVHNGLKADCKHGHPLSGDNMYINSQGHRQCRTCRRARWHKYATKRKITEVTKCQPIS